MIVVVLCVISVVLVYSASSFKAQETYGDSNFFLKKHFYKVLIGFVIMLVVAQVNYRFWLSISPAFLALSLLVLIFMLLSPGVSEIRGSKRWLNLGFINFQPSEFARLALLLFLSLSLYAAKLVWPRSIKSFLFHLLIIGAIVIPVLLQPDWGSAILTATLALTLMFLAGERVRHLLLLGALAAPFFVFFLASGGYRTARIKNFISALNGENVAWQAQQSLIAFGNGHFFGLGLGNGRQKFHFLPDPFTDFIFAIFGEELGLLGTVAILALFVLLFRSGLRIAMNTPDLQGRLLATGLVLNIAVYAFTNMGVVLSLLPTTGVPMPFISYGGSALFVNMFAVGVLLNISENSALAKNGHAGNRRTGSRPIRIIQ